MLAVELTRGHVFQDSRLHGRMLPCDRHLPRMPARCWAQHGKGSQWA